MDVTFTPEQDALRAAVRDLLADRCAIDHVRAVMASDTGADLDLYRRLVDVGAAELPGALELGIVLEECGRAVAPAPVLTALGIAVPALEAAGADELLAAARAGEAIPVLALDPDHVTEGHVATHLLFVEGGELIAAEAAQCDIAPLATMDLTRRMARVRRTGGTPVGDASAALQAVERTGAVAVAHELVGVGQAALDRGLAHAKGREQFGKPIGTYQAVSHRLVESFMAVECARGLAYYAAWAIDAGAADADLAASQAKASASEGAVLATRSALQVHGGIGMTWEADLHLFLKRAHAGAALLGTASEHRRRIADLIGV